LAALSSPAINVRFTAAEALVARGSSVIPRVKALLDDSNPYRHARAIWLLARLGDDGAHQVEALLDDADVNTRLVAFRALRKTTSDIFPYATKLAGDQSALVRREVIVALTNEPFEKKKDLLLALADGFDGKDRWYLEALGTACSGHESEFYDAMIARYHGDKQKAEQWDARIASLAWRLHPAQAVRDLKTRAASPSLPADERSKALTALGFVDTRAAVEAMISLSHDKDKTVSEQATYWLAFRQGNDWSALWDWQKSGIDVARDRTVAAMRVKRNRITDPRMPLNEKWSSARDMSRNAIGARMLLALAVEGQLPEQLKTEVRKMLAKNEDNSVRIQAAAYYKTEGEAAAFSAPGIAKIPGDVAVGKAGFQKNCSTCHRRGDSGGRIGPDLTSIGSKFDRVALLENIIHPDAGIVFGYEAWTVSLKDGQSLFGFVVADGGGRLTLRDLTGKDHVLETSAITTKQKQEGSLMPSPSALGLSEKDLADLSAYLMSAR
jgi:putative heme-binding domain-containing protein